MRLLSHHCPRKLAWLSHVEATPVHFLLLPLLRLWISGHLCLARPGGFLTHLLASCCEVWSAGEKPPPAVSQSVFTGICFTEVLGEGSSAGNFWTIKSVSQMITVFDFPSFLWKWSGLTWRHPSAVCSQQSQAFSAVTVTAPRLMWPRLWPLCGWGAGGSCCCRLHRFSGIGCKSECKLAFWQKQNKPVFTGWRFSFFSTKIKFFVFIMENLKNTQRRNEYCLI